MVQLVTIKNIKGKDVTFLRIGDVKPSDVDWITAYVRISNPKEDYPNETFREGEVLGVDTAHSWNEKQTLDEKMKDAERQITELIEADRENNGKE